MKRGVLLIFACLCVVLCFGTNAHPQRKKRPTHKTTTAPTEPQKRVARKETVAEKIVLGGICKSPSLFVGTNAFIINVERYDRSVPTLLSGSIPRELNEAIRATQLWKHSGSAWELQYIYENKSYKTEIFPETYKKNEVILQALGLKDPTKDSVSSSDRSALYPVIKAYLIDTAIALRDTKSFMQGNLAAAYKENENAIEELANSKPEEGLSRYSDSKETPLLNVMNAALIDAALLMQNSYQTSKIGKFAVAYEENKALIESLAARNWKSIGRFLPQEQKALRKALQACAVDVANRLRETYRTENKGAFGEAYGKNATDIERLAAQNWENDSRIEFIRSGTEFVMVAPALCQVLTAYNASR